MTSERGRLGSRLLWPPPAPAVPCMCKEGAYNLQNHGHRAGLEARMAVEKSKAQRSRDLGLCVCPSAQVLLAKHKSDGMFYAVKVLQKKSILKKKEVPELGPRHLLSCFSTSSLGWLPRWARGGPAGGAG